MRRAHHGVRGEGHRGLVHGLGAQQLEVHAVGTPHGQCVHAGKQHEGGVVVGIGEAVDIRQPPLHLAVRASPEEGGAEDEKE